METHTNHKDIAAVNRIMGEGDEVYHLYALHLGLSDAAFRILYTMRVEDFPCSQSQICEITSLSRQTVNSALKKLVQEGYLELALSGVRHSKEIVLTKQGEAFMEDTIDRIFRAEDAAAAKIPADEMKAFLETFQTLTNHIRREIFMLMKEDEI